MDGTEEIIVWLESLKDDKNAEGMKRFGIRGKKILGVPVPVLRAKAKTIKCNHDIALKLWDTGIHEAQLLATMIADNSMMDREQADKWTNDFDSWDICDQCCINLFVRLPFVHEMIADYANNNAEFVHRTAFALIAALAVKDKTCSDDVFKNYLKLIEKHSSCDLNFVFKAVDWALRQIGKRNMELNKAAIECASRLSESSNKTARRIGRNSLKELTSDKIIDLIINHRNKK